jgi:hypothetical protein
VWGWGCHCFGEVVWVLLSRCSGTWEQLDGFDKWLTVSGERRDSFVVRSIVPWM